MELVVNKCIKLKHTLGDYMPKVLPSIFSYESMKAKWDEDNPDEPYNRQSDLIAGRYALDQWIVRIDDEGKVIATTGWKEHPTHTAVGGTKAVEGAPSGQYKAIVSERERQINQSKPLLAAFGHLSGDNVRWFNYMRQNGWAFVNDPNWEKYKTLIPEELLTDWLSRFPSNMGIRPVQGTEEMSKAVYSDEDVNWFNLNKNERYTISIGKKGYDVVDNKTNQPVNRTGLSRSRAKAMLAAIENGETDLTQYETEVKRKATSLQDWRTVLRKYLPDGSFEEYNIGEPVADLGTRDRFKDKNIKSLGNVQHKAFVTEQYLRQVSDRLPDASNSSMNTWLKKLNTLNLSKGKYWFFGTNVREDRTYVNIDVINKGDRYLDTGKKFNLQDMDSAIVFIGVSKSMVGKIKRGQSIPKGRKFINLWGVGGVRGLQKKDSRPFQRRGSIQKWDEVLKSLPPDDYVSYSVTEIDNSHVDNPPKAKDYDDIRVIVRGHYLKGVKGEHGTDDQNQNEIPLWVDSIKGLSQGKYWFYRSDIEDEYEQILADIYTTKGKKIAGTKKEFTRNMPRFDGKKKNGKVEYINKLVVFTNLFGKEILTLSQIEKTEHPEGGRKRHNYIYTGKKPNHPKGAAKEKENKEYKPVVLIHTKKDWAEGKTKEEIHEKYSEIFDTAADKIKSFKQNQQNIKVGNMTPETKAKKTDALEKVIIKLLLEIKKAYKEYGKDLKVASKKLEE